METEVAAGLDWADRDYEILCRHVLEHGEQDWALIAAVLMCPVELLALKWEVLRVRAQELTGDGTVPSGRKWDSWELGMLLRGIDAFPDFKQAKLCRVLASWLPGRTKNGVKQALNKYIYPCYGGNLAKALREELPQTITGVLMRWQRQTDVEIPAHQVADYILSQAPELLTTAPSSKTTGFKRKRAAVSTEKQPSVCSEQAGFGANLTAGEAQSSPLPAVGAAAVGRTFEGVWGPLGSYSPALSSSSSSMVWPGNPMPGSSPLTICTQMPTHTDETAAGPDSSRSVTMNVAAAGFNTIIMQYNMSQQQSQACVVHQQQQVGMPTKRQCSRLSQATSQCMQHTVAAAAATPGPVQVPMTMHGPSLSVMPQHDAMNSQAAWVASGGTTNHLAWTMTATTGALESGLLMPALNNCALYPGQQPQQSTSVWQQDSMIWDAAASTSVEAAAASSAGDPAAAAACEAATVQLSADMAAVYCAAHQVRHNGQQAEMLACMGFEVPPASFCLQKACHQLAEPPMFAAQPIPYVSSIGIQQQQPGIVTSYLASDQDSATASPTAAPCHLNDLLTVMDMELQEMFGKLESSLGLALGFMDDDGGMARSRTGDDMSLDDTDILRLSPKLLDDDWLMQGC